MLQAIYDEAALDLVIDYHQPPILPLTESDWEWLQTYLQEAGDSPVVMQGDRAKSP